MSFITTLKNLFGFNSNGHKSSPNDRQLVCEDCKKTFIFDEGEQRFFKTKGFTDPKRCPDCRKKVKDHLKKKFRRHRGSRSFKSKKNSLIDGRSPYVDQR